jgi:hypothetical protein
VVLTHYALQETVLGSISAVVFFSLAIDLANSANQYASLGINHVPLIMPAQATAVSKPGNFKLI